MSFIYPNFLWALTLVTIPVIIHLVNLRKHKTVYFSNVSLLKRVQKETKRKSKLKQLLILSCRILMIIGLVLAFAQPYIPTGNTEKQQAKRAVGIYIDNSFSMNTEGTEGKAIENAKQKAFAIVNGSQPNTQFALLTNDLSEQQNRFYSKTEIINLISEVTEGHSAAAMSTVQIRFKSLMENFLFETDKTLYFISDFQKHSSDIENFETDSTATYNFVPVSVNAVSNLYIDTCWFDAPTHHFNQTEQLNVRLVNQSESNYPQVPVNFYLNDSLKALSSSSLDAGETKVITLQYTNLKKGIHLGRIEISDYPIVYDNNLYLAYNVEDELNVLVVSNEIDKNIYWEALLGNDEYLKLETERANRLQISTLNKYSTIVLDELPSISTGLGKELINYANQGGSLVIIPAINSNIENYNQFYNTLQLSQLENTDTISIPISTVAYSHQLFADVFKENTKKVELPSIKYRYRTKNNQNTTETALLTFADQKPALNLTQFGNGKIYNFTFPLSNEQNEFKEHLLFLPTFFNIALQSSNKQTLYYTLNEEKTAELKLEQLQQLDGFTLKNTSSNNEFIPEITKQQGNNISFNIDEKIDAGHYLAMSNEQILAGFAFNYPLKESYLIYYASNELKDLSEKAYLKNFNIVESSSQDFSETIQELDNGKQLWKLFIVIALLFLFIEGAIIRFWK